MIEKKWKKRLIWVVSSMVVLLVVGYFAMNMAVSYVLKSMVPQVPIAISDLTDTGNSPQGLNDSTSTNEITSNASEAPIKSQESNEKNELKDAADSPQQAQKEASSSTQAADANAQTSPSSPPKGELDYQAQVTTEKAKVVEDSISLKEKAAVTSVLMRKLSASDLQLLASLAGGGLSVEEKRKAKAIILTKLSEDEYNQLIQIAAKYGLSEGKSFQDSKKESLK